MTKNEFILILREELKKLPPEEIVAATEYFEEYFNEALENGEKTEEELVSELGSPKRAAAQIKADYAARLLNGDESILNEKPTVKKKISAVWWVIIGIVSAPLSIPLAFGLAFAAFCIILTALCIIISIYATIIFGAVMTVFAFVMGVIAFAKAVTTGIMFIGCGLIGAAITAAAAVGAFLGTKALIKAIAKAAKRRAEKRRMKKLGEGAAAEADWTYVNTAEDAEEEAFMEEMRAEAEERGEANE